jgi:hypothetical protein
MYDKVNRKRINFRIPPELWDFIHQYAEVHGTTVTEDYVSYLYDKKKNWDIKHVSIESPLGVPSGSRGL